MLIIAYPSDPDFVTGWPRTFKLNPQLAQIDELLKDKKLILLTTNDLALSAPQALWNGRPSTPVVVTLRTAVARRLKNWSYRTAEDEINGSLQWQVFCALAGHTCPDHSTLQTRERLIHPATLHRINDRVVRLAQQRGVSAGRKLRADGSVTETHIHYPTDSRLLADSLRVLGRTLRAARVVLKPRSAQQKFQMRDSHRQAEHLARQIGQQQRGRTGEKKSDEQGQTCLSAVGAPDRTHSPARLADPSVISGRGQPARRGLGCQSGALSAVGATGHQPNNAARVQRRNGAGPRVARQSV
jgi:IS5 family transposase